MANQEQNPPQQEQPFVAAKQVGFNLEDILRNTNNEVALLYPEHNNKDYFKCVSNFISKCCLGKPFTRSPNMYKEYLAEFWYSAKALDNSNVFFSIPTGGIFREIGVNTFRNAIGVNYLPHSSEYVAAPSINVVRQWFLTIGYEEEVLAKGTLKKSLLPPRWSKEATKGGSSKEPISSKIGHSKKRKESSTAMDSNPSQPQVLTHVDTRMIKEDQQATGGPTSLGVPVLKTRASLQPKNDASAASTTEADPENSAPTYYRKRGQLGSSQIKEETSSTIKLEDLAKLVSHVQPSFKDLDLPDDDPVIVMNDSDEDEDDEVHATKNSQKYKLELEKNKAEAKDALLKAQPSFPNVEQVKELLVKSLKTKFSNILSAHDFSSSLPTKLKDLPSKFNDLTEELKTLYWELPAEFLVVPPQVNMIQAKLKTLDALPSLLNKVTNALNQFGQAITSNKIGGDSVPLAGQAGTQPAKEEKNTNQAIISQLFQRSNEKEHLNKQQPKPTTPPTTPIITTTTTQMQSPFPQTLPKGSSQTEGEHIKKDTGKKALSSEETVKESIEIDSDDDETHLSGFMVESSRIKKVKKFDFVTKDGKHIYLTEEQINQQKKIKEEAKAKAAKRESEVRKEYLIDLLCPQVVNKYYNDKLQNDRYCDKMLNRKAISKITNCDVLTRKGPITLKVYIEDGTSEII
ncbi:hypothetical protein Tco_1083733, partial [Tanacetum coccineum]